MVYYTGYEEATRNTAGGKAPADLKKLCEKRGYSFVKILSHRKSSSHFAKNMEV